MCAFIITNAVCGVSGIYFTSCVHLAAQFQALCIETEKLIANSDSEISYSIDEN